jgi:hypothetical protein
MVARTKPEPNALVVTFSRDGEESDSLLARDGEHAWKHAIHLLAKRQFLLSGDNLSVRRSDDEKDGQNAAVVRGLPRPQR